MALSGKRVLVTGASGVVAFPVAVELAKHNEVYAVARFSDIEQSRRLESAGAQPIAFDLANPDLSPLPEAVDVVINYAVLPPTRRTRTRSMRVRRAVWPSVIGIAKRSCMAAPGRCTPTKASVSA